jgi:hypothetical protein
MVVPALRGLLWETGLINLYVFTRFGLTYCREAYFKKRRV